MEMESVIEFNIHRQKQTNEQTNKTCLPFFLLLYMFEIFQVKKKKTPEVWG
jgi:hypothetical protein